jgi:methylmalonyl-CoA/ethylmalonyl-CoA epimerase
VTAPPGAAAALRFPGADQVALLVPDLPVAVHEWSALLGVAPGDWYVHTYGPDSVPEHFTYRDQPGRYRMRLALVGSGPQIELIQPLDGPSIYHDWIRERGHGLHHLGFRVGSIEDAERRAREAGVAVIQTGRCYGADGTGGFAYLDTEGILGVITELIEMPARRRASEVLGEREARR